MKQQSEDPPGAAQETATGDAFVPLSQSERTRVWRQQLADGSSVIGKQPLGSDAARRVQRERAALARLAGVIGVSQLAPLAQPEGWLWLTDERGVALSAWLREHRMPFEVAVHVGRQLAHTLASVHRLGLLHLDVNPANVLLAGTTMDPVLIDFNLAGSAGAAAAGATAGTPAYLAPEQTGRSGRGVDQRTDLYALGATLYELLTGRRPFATDDPLALMHAHLARVPEAPSAIDPRVPQALSEIVMRLLEKDPDRRYQSAEGLEADLARLQRRRALGEHAPFTLGERDFPPRLAPPSRLVGRDRELAALDQALDRARQRPVLVLVRGAPGVGKTALVNELRAMAARRGGWFVGGKFDQYRREAAVGAVVQCLRALAALLLAEPEERLPGLRLQLRDALGVNGSMLVAAAPDLGLLTGLEAEPMGRDPTQTISRFRQAFRELLHTVVSAERPLVIVIDDLQWGPARTIGFVEAVVDDARLAGVLVVAVYRPGDAAAGEGSALGGALRRWNERESAPLQIELEGLAAQPLAELLQRMLRLTPERAAALAPLLAARTAGNPYDTVELVNALRRDGVLQLGAEDWWWQPDEVRRHVGSGDVIELLAARIEHLPAPTLALVEVQAALGGASPPALLRTATAFDPAAFEAALAPAIDEGLLVLQGEGEDVLVLFRHDRVQQAAHGRLARIGGAALHLVLARRLAVDPAHANAAAEQYLLAAEAIDDNEERRRAIALLHAAADEAMATNHAATDRLAAGAMALLAATGEAAAGEPALRLSLGRLRAVALHALGRHQDLDAVYDDLVAQGHSAELLTPTASTAIKSLSDRGLHHDALRIGLALLRQLGLDLPEVLAGSDVEVDDADGWQAYYRRVRALDLAADLEREPLAEPRQLAVAEVIERLLVSAYFTRAKVAPRLLFEGQRLWSDHGPSPYLLNVIAGAIGPLITVHQDFATSHRLVRHALEVGTARGWEPQVYDTLHYLGLLAMPWAEPLEACTKTEQRAREGLMRWGLLPQAAYTFIGEIVTSFECALTLAATDELTVTAAAFANRVGNVQAATVPPLFGQLVRALRGESAAPGSLPGPAFDPTPYLDGSRGVLARAACLTHALIAAAVFGDLPQLSEHAQPAMALVSRHAHYRAAQVHALAGLTAALQLQLVAGTDAEASNEAAASLDHCLAWLRGRAAEAPMNFAHLAAWIEAERAWAQGDLALADAAFVRALRALESITRPWHRALITERAGLHHSLHGPEDLGRDLLARARDLYAAWGAAAKVRQLVQRHAFLQSPSVRSPARDGSAGSDGLLAPDTLDMSAILRASRLLSSETTIERLEARLAEVLGALTGAGRVQLVVRGDDGHGWWLPAGGDEGAAAALELEEAAARRRVPASVLRYALRTGVPLVIDDALRDDRFARDPYFAGGGLCALMVVPIVSQGEPRALLLLENRLARGAFSAARLDAVTLIAGQLAVSLDNARLYASLERKVARRTAELQELVGGLESFNRSVSHDLRGPLGGIAGLATLAMQALQRGDDTVARRVLPAIATQADSSGRLVASLLALARVGDATIARAPVQIASLVHEVMQQLSQADPARRLPEVRVDPMPEVLADAELLRPVMANLIGNAIKFAAGRAEPRIEVTGSADERELTVAVCDNGVGFAAEQAHRLFQPFARLHGRDFEGHGVGLSIVRRAVERHGGRVWARAVPDQGACFYFTLPKS